VSTNRQLLEIAKALRLQKGFSQNFLIDDACLDQIVREVVLPEGPCPLVEIGPGAGFLTQKLLQTGYPLTAIELDPKMIQYLSAHYSETLNFHLVAQDVLKVDLVPLLAPQGILIGNIPYHLTGPILFQVTGELFAADYPMRQKLIKALLMVQKEVGERLTALPGEKAYSQLTLQAQFWFEVERVCLVQRTAFYPRPKVDSMVVRLTPRKQPAVSVTDLAFFSRLIKLGFMHRRKTFLNNLKIAQLAPENTLKSVLSALDLTVNCRAQELSMAQFGKLSDALQG
jgi:16S rRNA (adenine1518-N6/adenine1519-N6)-dimethyltransferase